MGHFNRLDRSFSVLPLTLFTGLLVMVNLLFSGFCYPVDILTENRQPSVLAFARGMIGVPYRFGGESTEGFDCSGFVRYAYRKAGIGIPRRVEDQYMILPAVERPEPGDVIFFAIDLKHVSHVGIYSGRGLFIHAARTGGSVRYGSLEREYWKNRYRGARCAIGMNSCRERIKVEGVRYGKGYSARNRGGPASRAGHGVIPGDGGL